MIGASSDILFTANFALTGLTLFNYAESQWERKPQFFVKNGSTLVYNSGNDMTVTLFDNKYTSCCAGYKLNPGWNLVSNSELYARTPNEITFSTYKNKPNCTLPAIYCYETKSISQLFAEGRIYDKVFFFNNLQSTEPSVFYTRKEITVADLATYKIPALGAFWIYLYQ